MELPPAGGCGANLRSTAFRLAVASAGALRAELLDEDGKVVPGFTSADCVPVAADATKARVAWKGGATLSAFRGRDVRFRFVLENGTLYSFWVSRRANGASNGYLAGGIASSYAEACTILENYGRRNGGGSWDSLSVGCTYRGNSTMGCGGAGIEAEFEGCRLDGNKSYDAVGGATYNCNTRNCTVINNETAQYATLCLGSHVGDIICYNTVKRATNGGALDTDGSGACTAVNCTILSNSGGEAAVSHGWRRIRSRTGTGTASSRTSGRKNPT